MEQGSYWGRGGGKSRQFHGPGLQSRSQKVVNWEASRLPPEPPQASSRAGGSCPWKEQRLGLRRTLKSGRQVGGMFIWAFDGCWGTHSRRSLGSLKTSSRSQAWRRGSHTPFCIHADHLETPPRLCPVREALNDWELWAWTLSGVAPFNRTFCNDADVLNVQYVRHEPRVAIKHLKCG